LAIKTKLKKGNHSAINIKRKLFEAPTGTKISEIGQNQRAIGYIIDRIICTH
jgi:hypothetical protein